MYSNNTIDFCVAIGGQSGRSCRHDRRSAYDVAKAIIFGSLARGDHRPDSDLDLAVVLNGQRRDFIDTKLDMVDIAFDVLLKTGISVQAFPMWEGDLAHPERFSNPSLIRDIANRGLRLR